MINNKTGGFWNSLSWSIRTRHYWYLFPVLVLATTYGDIVFANKHTPFDYLLINFVELFMLFLGISIGYWTYFFHLMFRKDKKRDKEQNNWRS